MPCTENSDRSSAVTHFVILDTRHIYQNFGSRVINANTFKNSSAVISDMYLSRRPAIRHEYLVHALGPRVDFTRSPMAITPTNELNLAISAFSSPASCLRIRTGFKETWQSSKIKKNDPVSCPGHNFSFWIAITFNYSISSTSEIGLKIDWKSRCLEGTS